MNLKKFSQSLENTGRMPLLSLDAKKNNKINTISRNHSLKFYPVSHPTLKTGLQAMTTAAAAWLNKP